MQEREHQAAFLLRRLMRLEGRLEIRVICKRNHQSPALQSQRCICPKRTTRFLLRRRKSMATAC